VETGVRAGISMHSDYPDLGTPLRAAEAALSAPEGGGMGWSPPEVRDTLLAEVESFHRLVL